ncbi:hypothetical protein ACP275_09G038200 [Erythranthe tilingii]
MSNRRATMTRFSSTNDEVNDLILKLQALLPDSSSMSNLNTRVSAAKILKETSTYIKKLQREADDLSARLSKLLASGEITAIDADIISSLLKQ